MREFKAAGLDKLESSSSQVLADSDPKKRAEEVLRLQAYVREIFRGLAQNPADSSYWRDVRASAQIRDRQTRRSE